MWYVEQIILGNKLKFLKQEQKKIELREVNLPFAEWTNKILAENWIANEDDIKWKTKEELKKLGLNPIQIKHIETYFNKQ